MIFEMNDIFAVNFLQNFNTNWKCWGSIISSEDISHFDYFAIDSGGLTIYVVSISKIREIRLFSYISDPFRGDWRN